MAEIEPTDINGAADQMSQLPGELLGFDEEPTREEASPPEREEPEAEAESPEPEEASEETEETEAEEAEESASSEDTAPEAEEEGDWIEVTMPGGEKQTLPLDEVVKGYSRESDYQRKTQAVAEERRAIEAQKAETEKVKADYAQRLEYLLSQIPQDDPPDQSLIDEDPVEYTRQRSAWEDRQRQRQQWVSEQQRLQREQMERHQEEQKTYLANQEKALVEKWPELGQDIPKGRQMIADVKNGLRDQYGYSEDELNMLMDHRAILIAKDALAYRQQQSASKKVQAKLKAKPKVAKPGAKQSKGQAQTDRLSKKVTRLKKSGHHRDAASVFEDLLED